MNCAFLSLFYELYGNMRRENSIVSGLSLESRRRGFVAEAASGLDPIVGDPTEAPSAKVAGKQGWSKVEALTRPIPELAATLWLSWAV
jgi:hypothetical protein